MQFMFLTVGGSVTKYPYASLNDRHCKTLTLQTSAFMLRLHTVMHMLEQHGYGFSFSCVYVYKIFCL